VNGLIRLQRLLDLLAVTDRCTVQELAAAAGWSVNRTKSIVEFLAEHGMVLYRSSDNMVTLDSQLRRLLVEED